MISCAIFGLWSSLFDRSGRRIACRLARSSSSHVLLRQLHSAPCRARTTRSLKRRGPRRRWRTPCGWGCVAQEGRLGGCGQPRVVRTQSRGGTGREWTWRSQEKGLGLKVEARDGGGRRLASRSLVEKGYEAMRRALIARGQIQMERRPSLHAPGPESMVESLASWSHAAAERKPVVRGLGLKERPGRTCLTCRIHEDSEANP